MDETLPMRTPTVPWRPFAVVTLVAAILAGALDLALAWGLAVPEGEALPADLVAEAEAAAAEAPPVRPRLGEQAYVTGILGRNLFDPNAIGKGGGEGGGVGGPPELNLRLKGTVVAEPAIYSAAFIEEEGQPLVRAYGIGQLVQGAEILAIERFRVRVRHNDQEHWLEVGADKPEAESSSTSTTAGGTSEGVTQDGETKFTIQRSMLDEKLSDLASLQKEARALLHRGPDGEYDGYRLSAIRRGSMLDSIGVKNGDIIHSVNGLQLDSVDGAMRALEQLRSEGSLKVDVTRRGSPVTLEYEIR